MVSAWVRARARERVEALADAGLGDRDMRRQALGMIAGVTGFSSYAWLLTDPVSTVGTAPLAEMPAIAELPALIKAKYATAVNRWTSLLDPAGPVALLSQATHGDLARSRVWRDAMSRYGVADVASVAFADQYGCWGFLDLWRDAGYGTFGAGDAGFLASLAAPLAGALRRCVAGTFVQPAAGQRHDTSPVVLTLDEDLRITSRTAASRAWLDVLLPPGPSAQAVPASVYNVAAQLLAAEEGVDGHPAVTRAHLAGGFWLTLRAARLSPGPAPLGQPAPGPLSPGQQPPGRQPSVRDGAPTIVVTIEEAPAADRLDLFSRAFGLSARERELVGLLATGSDTRAMARQMTLSELTVQDHLKSIFAKTGARDRVTLLSRALGTG
jgi:DNA-binding CsgD family transcriptional regulator